MKTVMFAGAGSVGKTTLLETIMTMCGQRNIKVGTHRSTTRRTYARAGLLNEQEQMQRLADDPVKHLEELMLHQDQVMADNSLELHAAAQRCKKEGMDLFVCDRSPYDYSSYFFNVFTAQLTLELIERKRRQAQLAMENVLNLSNQTLVVHLPFPAHWSADTTSSDGWRADKTGKNFVWSSICNSELQEAERLFLADPTMPLTWMPKFTRLNSFVERGPVDLRAYSVLNLLYPHLR